jgi:Fe2+ or Zn2+ uptake regulation protein
MPIPVDSPLSANWLERLQSSGYRLTGPRRLIAEIMAASRRALGPLEVYDQGRRGNPGLGLVTVYRTLEKLEELGLVQRVHMPGGCHRYLRASQGHQHLLLCTSCGRAEFFSGDDLASLAEQVAGRTGFTVQEHFLQLYGVCQSCREAA